MERDDTWDENDGEELEAEIVRADHAFGVDLSGTTEEESLAGRSLDQALAQERLEERTVDEALEVVDDGVPDIEAARRGRLPRERRLRFPRRVRSFDPDRCAKCDGSR